MTCAGDTKIWDLTAGELVRLDGARGTTLRVTRGRIWLTQERDTRDIVLEAGDVFTIEHAGRTVIEALGGATMCVLSHYVEAVRVPATRRPVGSRLRDFLIAARHRGGSAPPRALLLISPWRT